MSNDKADQAREGLLNSIAGKAKEVAGAVSGKDALVEEGQLQQAEAASRKAAIAQDAVATARRDQTAQELREANREASEEKAAAGAQAAHEETAVEHQRESAHAAAAREAEREEAVDRVNAERQAEQLAESRLRDAEAMTTEAASTEKRALNEQSRLEREATIADEQAALLRAETEK